MKMDRLDQRTSELETENAALNEENEKLGYFNYWDIYLDGTSPFFVEQKSEELRQAIVPIKERLVFPWQWSNTICNI